MCDMTPLELPAAYRVLLVDDDDGVRSMMTQTLYCLLGQESLLSRSL